jgi:diguanylate cyclase (GGDEF)-like protein
MTVSAIGRSWLWVLLIGGILTALVCATRYSDRVAQELEATQIDARFAADHAEVVLQTLKLATAQVAREVLQGGDIDQIDKVFEEIETLLPTLHNLVLIGADGVVLAEMRDDLAGVGLNVSDRDYVEVHTRGVSSDPNRIYVAELIESRVDGMRSVPVSRAVVSADGELQAVVAAPIDAVLLETIHYGAATADSAQFFLSGRGGLLPLGPQNTALELPPALANSVADEASPILRTYTGADGSYIHATAKIPDWPLSVVVARSYGDIRASALKVAFLPGIVGFLVTAATVAGTRLYSNAYSIMEEKRVEAENLSTRAKLASKAGRIGVWEFDMKTNALIWDETIMALYGIQANDFGRSLDDWTRRVHPDDFPTAQALMVDTLEKGTLYDTEFRVVWPDGQIKNLKAYGMAVYDDTGAVSRVIGVNYDLTDLRAAELQARNSERRFADIAQNMPGAIFQYEILPDGSDRILYLSPGCLEIWELSWDEIKGDPSQLWRMIDPEELPAMQQSIGDAAASLTQWDHRWHITPKSGQRKWLHGRGRPQKLPDGTVRFNSLILDVTENEQSKLEMERARSEAETARSRLENAIEALNDAFVLFDADERIVTSNSRYREQFADMPDLLNGSLSFEELVRKLVELGLRPDATGREEEWIKERVERYRNPSELFEMTLPGNRYVEVHESLTENGDLVSMRIDVTEKRRQTQKLEKLAKALETAKEKAVHDSLHDALTGLPNRRHLEQCIEERRMAAAADDEIAALHIDIDRFRQINDTLGHATGDQIILHVAEVLSGLRPDTAFVARVGADEFVLVCSAFEDFHGLCQRIMNRLSQPVDVNGQSCRFSVSIGVAVLPAGSASDLIVNTDIALQKAKDGGRNRFAVFTKQLQSELSERKKLADELLQGLEREEFEAFYQPQFDARTHEFAGLEALARWRHPQRGILPPAAFLSIAEDLKVTGDLDSRILRQSIDACEHLTRQGIAPPKLSVNIGFDRISDPHLMGDLENLEFCGPCLSFELLETIFLDEQTEEIAYNIERIRQSGISIELDDFGSGRASMVSLLKLKPDHIKIDRQLIVPMLDTPGQIDLIRAIVEMAQARDIKVTAEGVETREHARLLAEVGCGTLQGYVFARPMPLDELSVFLKKESWREVA